MTMKHILDVDIYNGEIMKKLKILMKHCKADIHVTINDHKAEYVDVKQYFKDKFEWDPELKDEFENDILKTMIKTDTIIEIQFYPDSPIGSYQIFHYDLDLAMDEALEIIKNV